MIQPRQGLFYRVLLLMEGHIFCQGDRQVKAEGQVRVPLLKAVDLLFRLPAALGEQDLGVLDDGGVQGGEAVALIDLAQHRHHALHFYLLFRQQLHETGQGPGTNDLHKNASFP